MGFWTADKQRYAYNYLRNAGLSQYGAAALVSRWANVESTANGPMAVNPYSGAFGIAQWLGARLTPIRGNTNFDAQLAYAVRELNSTESRAGGILRNAQTATEGAIGASTYERAEGYNAATGKDNFTATTAGGVNGVLVAAGAQTQQQPVASNAPVSSSGGDFGSDYLGEPGGISKSVVLLIAVGLGAYLLLR